LWRNFDSHWFVFANDRQHLRRRSANEDDGQADDCDRAECSKSANGSAAAPLLENCSKSTIERPRSRHGKGALARTIWSLQSAKNREEVEGIIGRVEALFEGTIVGGILAF
jgi:hypothetical protein